MQGKLFLSQFLEAGRLKASKTIEISAKELVCYTTCINPQPHFFQRTLICFRDIIFFVKRYIFIENEQLKFTMNAELKC